MLTNVWRASDMSKYMYIFTERLGPDGWIYDGEHEPNSEYDPETPNEEPELAPIPLYDVKDYVLFSLFGPLYYPVLRVDEPLATSRGLPADLSSELRAWQTSRQRSAEGHGWLTVRELCSFPWENQTTIALMVQATDVPRFLKDREIAAILQAEIDIGIGPRGPAMQMVEWQVTYAEAAGSEFMNGVVSRLRDEYGPVDNARIVYWFR